MYKPLPHFLTVQPSPIHGLGLYATMAIPNDTNLGLSHVKFSLSDKEYIRTPLGGFINHSDTPNCTKSGEGSCMITMKTLREIRPGEEITVRYTLYKPPPQSLGQ